MEKIKGIDLLSRLSLERDTEEDQQTPDYGFGLSICKKIQYTGESEKETYVLQVEMESKCYKEEYTFSQLQRRKFLQDYGIEVQDERKFYQKLRKEILEMEFPDEYISCIVPRNGLQKVKGRWMYVFGN